VKSSVLEDVRMLMMAFIYSSITEGSDLPSRMCLLRPELKYRLAWKKIERRYPSPPVHECYAAWSSDADWHDKQLMLQDSKWSISSVYLQLGSAADLHKFD
jgi:hypothetical protein